MRELLAEAAAAHTIRSYATALGYWAGWHQACCEVELALPASEAVAIHFLMDYIQRRSKTELVKELPPALDQPWSPLDSRSGPAPEAVDRGPAGGGALNRPQAQTADEPMQVAERAHPAEPGPARSR